MRFRTTLSTQRKPNGVLVYRPQEYSFDVEPAQPRGFTSILVDDLNLEIDDRGRVLSIWGLCPHTRWLKATLTPPEADFGEVFFVPDVPLSRGVSIQLNHNKYLPVHVDPESGWVRIRGAGTPVAAVKLLPGVVLEFTEQGQFCSLWLMSRRATNADSAKPN
jgi:hypothetical protein